MSTLEDSITSTFSNTAISASSGIELAPPCVSVYPRSDNSNVPIKSMRSPGRKRPSIESTSETRMVLARLPISTTSAKFLALVEVTASQVIGNPVLTSANNVRSTTDSMSLACKTLAGAYSKGMLLAANKSRSKRSPRAKLIRGTMIVIILTGSGSAASRYFSSTSLKKNIVPTAAHTPATTATIANFDTDTSDI